MPPSFQQSRNKDSSFCSSFLRTPALENTQADKKIQPICSHVGTFRPIVNRMNFRVVRTYIYIYMNIYILTPSLGYASQPRSAKADIESSKVTATRKKKETKNRYVNENTHFCAIYFFSKQRTLFFPDVGFFRESALQRYVFVLFQIFFFSFYTTFILVSLCSDSVVSVSRCGCD